VKMGKLVAMGSLLMGLAACASVAPAPQATAPQSPAAQSAGAAPQSSAAQSASTNPSDSKDPIVCRDEVVTGSRLDNKRICMKASQWNQLTHNDQSDVNDAERHETNPQGN